MILTQPQPNLATPRNQPQAALANYTTLARSMQPILTTPVLQDESQPKNGGPSEEMWLKLVTLVETSLEIETTVVFFVF